MERKRTAFESIYQILILVLGAFLVFEMYSILCCLQELDQDVLSLKKDISHMSVDVNIAPLSSDLSSIKKTVSSLSSDLKSLKENVSSLGTDVSSIKSDISSINKEVSYFKYGFESIRIDTTFIRENITAKNLEKIKEDFDQMRRGEILP